MSIQEKIWIDIGVALNRIKHRLLHPEEYDYHGQKLYSPSALKARGEKPLAPRHRLSARLELLTALKRYEIDLMKEIKLDTDSLADAKKNEAGGNVETIRE